MKSPNIILLALAGHAVARAYPAVQQVRDIQPDTVDFESANYVERPRGQYPPSGDNPGISARDRVPNLPIPGQWYPVPPRLAVRDIQPDTVDFESANYVERPRGQYPPSGDNPGISARDIDTVDFEPVDYVERPRGELPPSGYNPIHNKPAPGSGNPHGAKRSISDEESGTVEFEAVQRPSGPSPGEGVYPYPGGAPRRHHPKRDVSDEESTIDFDAVQSVQSVQRPSGPSPLGKGEHHPKGPGRRSVSDEESV